MLHAFSSPSNHSIKTFHILNKIIFSSRRSIHGHHFHSHERAQSQQGSALTFRPIDRTLSPSKDQTAETPPSAVHGKDEVEKQSLCKVCCTREVGIAFIPCGHTAVCAKCSERLKSCPYCKRSIRGKLRVYFL